MLDKDTCKEIFIAKGIQPADVNRQRIYTVVGIDAQISVGPLQDYDNTNLIGPFGEGERCVRGQHFLDVCTNASLTLHNTFVNERGGNWTCFHWGNAPASQIDYLMSDFEESKSSSSPRSMTRSSYSG